ncbi:hypothetical protein COLO4_21515 [Corchorus olitorius]|uniref:Bifunctional inhibitor/plant lipid transfer protein/seed storage helical domain-containing protein n=1 Tax=Corchorus olitorius TaxID=93759 RepID=A0A1R3IST7_9ROSI|nr:hypothetical protein COLO4_21515 [Corchorus olitorius]
MVTTMFVAFLHLTLLAMAEQPLPPPPPLQQPSCVEELVAFSPCLPYVSASPNNGTDFVAPECCTAFSSAFETGDGYCFCYIFRQPLIFGFPLNQSRVASLSSFCVAALPPLSATRPTTESGTPKPSNSGSNNNDSSASTYSPPPEPALRSPTPPSSSAPVIASSATNRIYEQSCWFLLGMMIFLLN